MGVKNGGIKGGAGADLAFCCHCGRLTPRERVERFAPAGHVRGYYEFERSRRAVCGARQLPRSPEAEPGRCCMKLAFDSAARRDVIRERCAQIGGATGRSLSQAVIDAVELYLYGEGGSWVDDPMVDGMVVGERIGKDWR